MKKLLIFVLYCVSVGAQIKPRMVEPIVLPRVNFERQQWGCPTGYILGRNKRDQEGKDHWTKEMDQTFILTNHDDPIRRCWDKDFPMGF